MRTKSKLQHFIFALLFFLVCADIFAYGDGYNPTPAPTVNKDAPNRNGMIPPIKLVEPPPPPPPPLPPLLPPPLIVDRNKKPTKNCKYGVGRGGGCIVAITHPPRNRGGGGSSGGWSYIDCGFICDGGSSRLSRPLLGNNAGSIGTSSVGDPNAGYSVVTYGDPLIGKPEFSKDVTSKTNLSLGSNSGINAGSNLSGTGTKLPGDEQSSSINEVQGKNGTWLIIPNEGFEGEAKSISSNSK
jgi:hypothetical protein